MGFLSSLLSDLLSGNLNKNLNDVISKATKSLNIPTNINLSQAENTVQELKYMWEKLPMYPLWTVGGSDFDLYGDEHYGEFHYRLTLKGTRQMLDAYRAILASAGFVNVTTYPDVYVMSKVINGECYAFIYTDAICEDEITVVFEKNVEYWPG